MLEIEELEFFYSPSSPILRGIDVSISQGEIVALIGCSGSGKTTLFRLITGLLKPTRGNIHLSSGPPTYMQQEDLLLPWRSVADNLHLPFELGKKRGLVASGTIADMLQLVGLAGYEKAYPCELSGGQRQRVALARALLQDRPLLLLDEPFGSLDVAIREQLYALLMEIREQLNKTIVLVTHDFRDAVEMADRILILREGEITADFKIPEVASEVQLSRQIRQLLLGKPQSEHVHRGEQRGMAPLLQEEYLQERETLVLS